MQLVHTKAELHQALEDIRRRHRSLGLVPTMGALHEGHLSLVRRSCADNEISLMSIFVNPTQFGPGEDLERYPRDLERDLRLARQTGINIVYAPEPRQVYDRDHSTWVEVPGPLSESLCGASRPGHFRGVCTVVAKLFNLVRPTRAYFGEKDFQQLSILRAMTRQLDIPVQIIGCPIVREPDGLALSSRNIYLDDQQRQQALAIFACLQQTQRDYAAGERSVMTLVRRMRSQMETAPGLELEYAEIRDPGDFGTPEQAEDHHRALLAARVGTTRLIDNMPLKPKPPINA